MMTSRALVRAVGYSAMVVAASCKESSGPKPPGPPAALVNVSSAAAGGFANTDVSTPIMISVRDASGTPLPNQTVTFNVTDGGGFNLANTAVSDANGTVTAPTWHLGKLNIAQTLRASIGSVTLDVPATITTQYSIVVRFFGPAMTATQQAVFFTAAHRIEGIVTGALIKANAQNVDLTQCNITGQPPLNEIIDNIIIYASIEPIDGPGKILAQSGPCLFRSSPSGQPQPGMPAVGVMNFDSADINTITGSGSLLEVITHEMIHSLGFGVIWDSRGLLSGKGTPDPRFTGSAARLGCVAVGGTVTCANSVPLENTGGAGTVESHWRELTFDTELMTGFIDPSPNPLSVMTIGSLADLGYVVNNADSDSYVIPGGMIQALRSNNPSLPNHVGWEKHFMTPDLLLLENGQVHAVRRK